MLPAVQGAATEHACVSLTYRVQVQETSSGGRGRRWFAALVAASAVIGVIVAGRQAALSRADREFETRLRASDARRD